MFNDFISEANKKSFSLRRELFEKITELQRDIAGSVANYVTVSDLNLKLDGKADRLQLSQMGHDKAGLDDFRHIKADMEKLRQEMDTAPKHKDLNSLKI